MKTLADLAVLLLVHVPTKALTDELARRIAEPAPQEQDTHDTAGPHLAPKQDKRPPSRARVQTTDPVAYAEKVIRHSIDSKRGAARLTYDEIAEICDVGRGTIGNALSGKVRPSTAQKIVDALVAFTGYNRR